MADLTPKAHHTEFIKSIVANPMDRYVEFSERLRANGITAEFPEFAPVVHYMKGAIHTKEINDVCKANLTLLNFRRHADLALWHVSQSEAWYQYGATLRAIFFALQFLDTYQRTIDPSLNERVPFYHEYRYLYYFDYMINKAPDVVMIPTYENITATTLVVTRGPPIFFVGVSTNLIHVDEYKQTSAEFFIHDVNHGRRQYETSLRDYEANWKDKMALLDYYNMQIQFLNQVVKPLIYLKDPTHKLEKGIKQLIKIILFEIVHEDAQPAYPELICKTILRNAGHGEAGFQVVYTNPNTGLPNIRKIKNPGGGILAFVKYKLRYGFLDEALEPLIVEKEFRRTEKIAEAAHILLSVLSCDNIPPMEELIELTDNMAGQNPPAHANHLGEPINLSKFTGVRPTPLNAELFEKLYNKEIPWTGFEKKVVPLEKRAVAYNATKEANETARFLEAASKEGGGTRRRRRQKRYTRKRKGTK
jgi:hypothetical protein